MINTSRSLLLLCFLSFTSFYTIHARVTHFVAGVASGYTMNALRTLGRNKSAQEDKPYFVNDQTAEKLERNQPAPVQDEKAFLDACAEEVERMKTGAILLFSDCQPYLSKIAEKIAKLLER